MATLKAPPSRSANSVSRVERAARDVAWAPWVLGLAAPALFLHFDYQPKVSFGLASTPVDLSLADAAIASVLVAAAVCALRAGLEPLRAAWMPLVAAGSFVALALLSLATPSLLGQEYALAPHAVSALKFAWYALLMPAVLLIVRSRSDVMPLLRVVVAWSALATSWGVLQFLGLVDEFEGRRPGQREPSFVGIHDLAALSGAALALGLCTLLLTRDRPLQGRWGPLALVAGGVGVVLSGAMTGLGGVWLALAAVALLARSRRALDVRGLAAAAAILLVASAGTALMRGEELTRFAEFIGLRDKVETTGIESYPQRTLLAYIGARIWLDHPIAGAGWQASSEEWAYGPQLDDARRRFPDQPQEAFPSPERPWGVQLLYVQVLADLGAVGLAVLLALFATAVAAAVRGARASPLPLVGLSWLLVCAGVWAALGLVAGIPTLALTWIALGLMAARG